MWMMGYSEATTEFNVSDSFNGRRLRHLIPRPSPPTSSSTNPPSYLSRFHGTDMLALNQHLAVVPEQGGKKEFGTQQVVVSSRWNPTPEQIQALEELYRRGTRTPTADQIQHITAQLRRYGKIEGKNVFYWFQNHKARERQKRRRQLESGSDEQHPRDSENTERKETGSNRTAFEVEQTKSWVPSSNCSTTTLPENTVTMGRSGRGADGWLQFREGELQQRRGMMMGERNATWQAMRRSSSTSPVLQLPTLPSSTVPMTTNTVCAADTVAAAAAAPAMDPNKLIKVKDLSIFIYPTNAESRGCHYVGVSGHHCGGGDDDDEESRTLQLFPLPAKGAENENGGDDDGEKEGIVTSAANFTPYQFFEFLPLKN